MVIKTRSKAGRSSRAGRGPTTHQQIFGEHIRHGKVKNFFSNSREKFPEVKIKQEKIKEGIGKSQGLQELTGDTYGQGESSNNPYEIDEEDTEDCRQKNVKPDNHSESVQIRKKPVQQVGDTTQSLFGKRVAKRSRTYYKDIREFSQKINASKTTLNDRLEENKSTDSSYRHNNAANTTTTESIPMEALEYSSAEESDTVDVETERKSRQVRNTEQDEHHKETLLDTGANGITGGADEITDLSKEFDQLPLHRSHNKSSSWLTANKNGKNTEMMDENIIQIDEEQQGQSNETNDESDKDTSSVASSITEMYVDSDDAEEELSNVVTDPTDEERISTHHNDAETQRSIDDTTTGIVVDNSSQKKATDLWDINKTFVKEIAGQTESSTKQKKVSFDDQVETYEDSTHMDRNYITQRGLNSPHTMGARKNANKSNWSEGGIKSFVVTATAQKEPSQTIQERGYTMVDDKTIMETPVKIEFNMGTNVTEFNVRANLLTLLEHMKKIDRTLKVKSTIKESKEWETTESLPENEEFSTHFQVREFSYRKTRKVLVHVTLVTMLPINKIKYTNVVKDYIFDNNIWLKTDHFNTKVESSPGIITMLNPKLINRDDYTNELKYTLMQANQNLDVTLKLETETAGINSGDERPTTPVPYFYLESSVKKWGGINADVLRLNCAKEDSEFLKHLMSVASERNLLQRGLFVPSGLHLMEGKEVVANILHAHNTYIQQSVGIPIIGIGNTHTNKEETLHDSAIDTIKSIEGVESIEKGRDYRYTAQWIIVTSKSCELRVEKELANNLDKLYKSQGGQSRLILAGKGRLNARTNSTNKVATYAEILSRKYAPRPTENGTGNKRNDEARSTNRPSSVQNGADVGPSRKTELTDSVRAQLPPKTHPGSEDLHLREKIQQLETTQEQLIQTQKELLQAQKTITNDRKSNDVLEETNKKQRNFEEQMEQKWNHFRQDQEKQLEETRDSITKEMNGSWKKKIDTISVTVANQVAAQLVQVFKQYMAIPDRIEGSPQTMIAQPLLTQEAYVAPAPQITQGDTDPVSTSTQLQLSVTSDTSPLNDMEVEDTTITQQSSPHDTTTELSNGS